MVTKFLKILNQVLFFFILCRARIIHYFLEDVHSIFIKSFTYIELKIYHRGKSKKNFKEALLFKPLILSLKTTKNHIIFITLELCR